MKPLNHPIHVRSDEEGVFWWHWLEITGPVVRHVDTVKAASPDWPWMTHARIDPKENGCSGCGKKKQMGGVRWLGIRWMGKPYPKRLRLRKHWWPIYAQEEKGCGCIVKLKALKIVLVSGARYVWRA